jgi:hypothetical protein
MNSVTWNVYRDKLTQNISYLWNSCYKFGFTFSLFKIFCLLRQLNTAEFQSDHFTSALLLALPTLKSCDLNAFQSILMSLASQSAFAVLKLKNQLRKVDVKILEPLGKYTLFTVKLCFTYNFCVREQSVEKNYIQLIKGFTLCHCWVN